jgi:hypothetical protein
MQSRKASTASVVSNAPRPPSDNPYEYQDQLPKADSRTASIGSNPARRTSDNPYEYQDQVPKEQTSPKPTLKTQVTFTSEEEFQGEPWYHGELARPVGLTKASFFCESFCHLLRFALPTAPSFFCESFDSVLLFRAP